MSRRPSTLPSLLQLLTVPFVALVLLLCAVIGVLSYRAAQAAVDEAARLWLQGSVQRIGEVLDHQRAQADAVLQAAFPLGVAPPPVMAAAGGTTEDSAALRDRLWTALAAHPEPTARLRFTTNDGRQAEVRRLSATDAEWLLRGSDGRVLEAQLLRQTASAWQATTTIEPVASTLQPVAPTVLNAPAEGARWSALAIDRRASALVHERQRPVRDAAGQAPAGTVSTEMRLKALDDALRDLPRSPRAVAFVVERDGLLVAASQGGVLRRRAEGGFERVGVADAGLPLVTAAYLQLLPHLGGSSIARPGIRALEPADGTALWAGYGRIAEGPEQDWSVIVVAPRADFVAGLWANAAHTAAAALVGSALILLLGSWVRRRLVRDVRALVDTAGRVGDGDLDTAPAAMSSAEMAALGESLRRMQLRLRTDRITGLANREAVLTRLHDRMRPGRRRNDAPLIALLFVDLDRFKQVNDRHGHEAGDFVLMTLGRRLRQTVRDTDLVARWAGDEFVLLLDGVANEDSAQQVRDQVERVLRDPVELGPGRDAVELGGTVGLALYPADAAEPEALLRAAEEDMAYRKPASVSQW